MATSITCRKTTWTFDIDCAVGQFANGDWCVVGPVKIISITPKSEVVSGRTINGSMVNPVGGLAYQGYDSGAEGARYDAKLNVALDMSKPLELKPGSSLISTISTPTLGQQTAVQSAEILTVLETIPPAGSFRPPYCGKDKTIRYNVNQLNFGLLKKLSPVNGTPTLSDIERSFERPWVDHYPGWGGGSVHPADNMPSYGRNIAAKIGEGSLMLHLNFTDEQKRNLLIRFVQIGIDNFGIVREGLRAWAADGGHSSGRKWPILFAGLLLNDTDMKNIGQKSGDYLYSNGYGPGNSPPDYIHFGEDDQTFYVSQADVNIANEIHDGHLGHYYPNDNNDYPEYSSEEIGMPEWGIVHADEPWKDGNTWSAAYRCSSTAVAWPGFVLAARIMGANTPELWNHPALFDYMDRYMATAAPTNLTPDWRYSIKYYDGRTMNDIWGQYPDYRDTGFTGNMYDTYRNQFNVDMIQLLLISAVTKKPCNNIGDVVGEFPITHIFSQKEKEKFMIVSVLKKDYDAAKPVITRTDDVKTVEKDGKTYEITNRPKYDLNYNSGIFTDNFTKVEKTVKVAKIG